MLAIAAIAAMRASTIATMTRGERLSVEAFVLVTSDCTVPKSVCIVPKAVWMVATFPLIEVTVPDSVPRDVWMVATLPSMRVTVVPIEASEVVRSPTLLDMVAVLPDSVSIFALMLDRLVVIGPKFGVEMLAMLPDMLVSDACMLLSEVVIVPVLVLMAAVSPEIVTRVPVIAARDALLLVTLLPMPTRVVFMLARLV